MPEPEEDQSAAGELSPVAGARLRRRAAHLYGLIVSGAVLAAAPDDVRLALLGIALVGTVGIYWIAETYVHWAAARTIRGHRLRASERREMLHDGLPLLTAAIVPLLVLLVEAVLSVETATAVRIALWVNVVLLVVTGWRISPATEGLGIRWGFAALTGVLGLAMIGLKTLLH